MNKSCQPSEENDVQQYVDPTHGKPFPITTTPQHYLVVRTNEVGVVVPCSCDDPLILEFKDGSHDAFHLRDLETTDLPATIGEKSPYAANRRRRPRQVSPQARDKMFMIHAYLLTDSKPVRRSQIEAALGYSCIDLLMKQLSYPHKINLERLNIVKRVPL